jgi:hypothetical protein
MQSGCPLMTIRAATITLISAFAVGHAAAQAPVALIEEIQGQPAGVEMMDYVSDGRIIKLGVKDTMILDYLKSCWRETIKGGATVIVGADQSDVQGGSVSREKVLCDAGKMQLTAELASKSGVMVFRDVPNNQPPSLLALRPQFFLYGTSPLVQVTKGSPIVIERVDKPGERYEIGGDNGLVPRGAFYDFADNNKALAVAGIYRATQGSVRVLFQIDLEAKSGKTPVAGRLLWLKPPS